VPCLAVASPRLVASPSSVSEILSYGLGALPVLFVFDGLMPATMCKFGPPPITLLSLLVSRFIWRECCTERGWFEPEAGRAAGSAAPATASMPLREGIGQAIVS
jgi:hypothetical protein